MGHASVEVTQSGDSDCYISWWPGNSRRPKFPKLAGNTLAAPLFASVYSAPARPNQTFVDDKMGEDGKNPDVSLAVKGLDQKAIKVWWDDFRANPPSWSSLDINCAMVAAFALRSGGADSVISGIKGWWHSWNTVWSPNDVIDLVEAINRGAVTKPI